VCHTISIEVGRALLSPLRLKPSLVNRKAKLNHSPNRLPSLDFHLILCHTKSMNKTTQFATDYPMTFRFAISVLEEQYDATYRGIKTVSEMCSSLTDWITWEGESPDAIYHQFETKVGANCIVADDQILQLANHYAS